MILFKPNIGIFPLHGFPSLINSLQIFLNLTTSSKPKIPKFNSFNFY